VHIVWTILIGFVVGLVARAITPGAGPQGFILTSLLGIAGSLIATYFGQWMGWYRPDEAAGFFGALLGAVVLCVLYTLVARKRA